MPLPIALAGGRLLTSAVRMLMKRYGLKKLEGRAARDLKARGARNATAKAQRTTLSNARKSGLRGKELINFARGADASKAEKELAIKAARRKQVAGNIAGDAAGSELS